MEKFIQFSGGKDSLATLLWAIDNLNSFKVIFCDVGKWEHPKTYQHIEDVQKITKINFIKLQSSKYKSFIEMVEKKKRFPATMSRFCTQLLKVEPTIDFILSLNTNVKMYQGIRAQESKKRAVMNPDDNYFKYYFEPYGYTEDGKPKYHTYRKKEVFKWCDKYSAEVIRPIFFWNHKRVFDLIHSKGMKANPLYYEGFSRVGCFPCINCSLGEFKQIMLRYPERIEYIAEEEKRLNSTFFPMLSIPERYCSKEVTKSKGEIGYAPTMEDMVNYLDKKQLSLFPISSCESVYSICE